LRAWLHRATATAKRRFFSGPRARDHPSFGRQMVASKQSKAFGRQSASSGPLAAAIRCVRHIRIPALFSDANNKHNLHTTSPPYLALCCVVGCVEMASQPKPRLLVGRCVDLGYACARLPEPSAASLLSPGRDE